MEHLIKIADLRELEKLHAHEEISYSRMVEMLNEIALSKVQDKIKQFLQDAEWAKIQFTVKEVLEMLLEWANTDRLKLPEPPKE